jgi:hypothetical protein
MKVVGLFNDVVPTVLHIQRRMVVMCIKASFQHFRGGTKQNDECQPICTPKYEGESNENLKNVINIRFPALLFCKLAVQLPML